MKLTRHVARRFAVAAAVACGMFLLPAAIMATSPDGATAATAARGRLPPYWLGWTQLREQLDRLPPSSDSPTTPAAPVRSTATRSFRCSTALEGTCRPLT